MGTAKVLGRGVLDGIADGVLGDGRDGMDVVVQRMERAYPQHNVIAWQGNAETFQFDFVSASAQSILGYPVSRWTSEPTFWADVVIVPDDRDESVAYCALATARKADHIFEYRARTSDGRILVLRDIVRVVVGAKGIPNRLRGLMFDVTQERAAVASPADLRAYQRPPHEELLQAGTP